MPGAASWCRARMGDWCDSSRAGLSCGVRQLRERAPAPGAGKEVTCLPTNHERGWSSANWNGADAGAIPHVAQGDFPCFPIMSALNDGKVRLNVRYESGTRMSVFHN